MAVAALVLAVLLMCVVALVAMRGGAPRVMSDPLTVERRHEWEQRLSAGHETRVIGAIVRFRGRGHDLILTHERGVLDVYQPPRVISLFALADVVRALDESAVESACERWLEAAIAAPTAGCLTLVGEGWSEGLVGSTPAQLAAFVADVLSGGGAVEGLGAPTIDEWRGLVAIDIASAGAPNCFFVALSEIVAAIARAPGTPRIEVVRATLRAAIAPGASFALYARHPEPEQRALLAAAIASEKRAAQSKSNG
jgi:hypothetical protein